MSIYEICERCDKREGHWSVVEAHIDIGALHRRPHLCEDCTETVMSVVLAALRPLLKPARSVSAVDPAAEPGR